MRAGTGIVFITWLYRVGGNADMFAPYGHQHGKGWAIGGWIVPIISLWFPWRVVVDCRHASAPVTGPYNEREPIDQGLVASWWSTWISSVVLVWITAAVVTSAETAMDREDVDVDAAVGTVQTSLWLEITENPCFTAAAVLAILVVRRLSALQDDRARAAAATTPAPADPAPAS
ncbi:DUF4328 domain-containing protein [Kitasatospora sp. NPDC054939]